ncbi:MAG: succinyl-diaminopimelate desuccinylase [Alphaproteobacteria bacterium]
MTTPTQSLTEPLALAQALIRCPSVTPKDEGALDVLHHAMESLGFTCHRLTFSEDGTADIDNLYARLGDQAPNFCYAGHTDVVPVGDTASWTVDPFGAEIIDGELYGRGASDMKGGIACFVAAVACFLESRQGDFDGSISMLITGDEEGLSINGTIKVLEWLAERGEKLDVCVVGEPTNPERLGDMVKIGRRGSLVGHLTLYGTQGHTAYPHLADNPVPRLLKMLTTIIEHQYDDGTEHFPASTIEVTTIDIGNPATNIIPAQVSATFNIRFNDKHSSATLIQWLRQTFDQVGGRYDFKTHLNGEPFLCPPGELSELLSNAVQKATGRVPDLSTTGGTSDARFIHRACPVAEFGLVGQTMHKADERVAVSDLTALAEIYKMVLDGYFPQK